jgi:CheY-like chemotaxis protein
MLRRSGHTTFTACNGLEALQTLQEHPEVDAVILDALMPVMSGEEAFRQIKDLWPSIRVIIVSGLVSENLEDRFGGGTPDGFLRKPFTLDALNDAVTVALN